jgi:hypothetical protein
MLNINVYVKMKLVKLIGNDGVHIYLKDNGVLFVR